jgi:hypothetical protein
MILFDNVIEVLTAPHSHVFPLWILVSQKPQCPMAGPVAVQRHLPRPPRQVASQCFAEKRLCGCNAAIGTLGAAVDSAWTLCCAMTCIIDAPLHNTYRLPTTVEGRSCKRFVLQPVAFSCVRCRA